MGPHITLQFIGRDMTYASVTIMHARMIFLIKEL